MRKLFGVFALCVFLLSFGSAFELTVVDEPGFFSGGVVRVRASEFDDYGDKISPSEFYVDVGVLKFDIETLLDEGDLLIMLLKNGDIVDMVEKNSLDFSNETLTVDLRELVEKEVVEKSKNVTEAVENLTEDIKESENFSGDVLGVTGKVISGVSGFKYYFIGGIVVLGAVFLFFLIRSAYKSGAEFELRELKKMEHDGKIDKLNGKR